MAEKLNVGILSTAKIAREYVIPAIQNSTLCVVGAIASRDKQRAKKVAKDHNIPHAFGSYEKLLAAPDIDSVYIPLPNHLHVEWSIKALKAGKHVLCEKPVGMNADEARELKRVSDKHPGLKVMEAFMYRHHPRWKRAKDIVNSGAIGDIRTVHSYFSYYNTDPDNYRNSSEMGGGALMDVGCYSVSSARLIFGEEPKSVSGFSDLDPEFGTDRLTSGLMTFGAGSSVFTCSTQSHYDQYVKIYGTNGMIEIDQPFNPDFSKVTVLNIMMEGGATHETFDPCNHFTLQADAFAKCIFDDTPLPVPLTDSIANMEVIDSIRSH